MRASSLLVSAGLAIVVISLCINNAEGQFGLFTAGLIGAGIGSSLTIGAAALAAPLLLAGYGRRQCGYRCRRRYYGRGYGGYYDRKKRSAEQDVQQQDETSSKLAETLELSAKELLEKDPGMCFIRLACEIGANPARFTPLLLSFDQPQFVAVAEKMNKIQVGPVADQLMSKFYYAVKLGASSGNQNYCRTNFACPISGEDIQAAMLQSSNLV